ncbi:MAG: hypothetical protein MPK30_09660, partial [Gammaproteobacteria bacterium]|nr:hypothetical protein [Gammaproteobacteria bacterium]
RTTAGDRELPGAQCWINDGKINDIEPPEVLDSGRTKGMSPETYPADAPARIDPQYNNGHRFTVENWNRTHVMTFRCTDPDGAFEPVTQTFKIHHIPPRPIISGPDIEFREGNTETDASKARNLHVRGEEFDPKLRCGYYDGDEFTVYDFDGTVFRVVSGAITATTPVTKEREVRLDCSPPGSTTAVFRKVAIVATTEPVLSGVADDTHTNDAVFTDSASCLGIFGGGVALDMGERAAITRTITAPGETPNELAENVRATIAIGAATGEHTIKYDCVQRVLGTSFTSTATQTITVNAPSTTTPAATVLDGAASDARIKDTGSYTHTLTCKENDVAVGNDRILFHPRLEDLPTNEDTSVEIYCPDTNGRTSEQSNTTVTIHLDTAPPVITPATGTLNLELGAAFTEEPACTDTNPDVTIATVPTTGVAEVRAALL